MSAVGHFIYKWARFNDRIYVYTLKVLFSKNFVSKSEKRFKFRLIDQKKKVDNMIIDADSIYFIIT